MFFPSSSQCQLFYIRCYITQSPYPDLSQMLACREIIAFSLRKLSQVILDSTPPHSLTPIESFYFTVCLFALLTPGEDKDFTSIRPFSEFLWMQPPSHHGVVSQDHVEVKAHCDSQLYFAAVFSQVNSSSPGLKQDREEHT